VLLFSIQSLVDSFFLRCSGEDTIPEEGGGSGDVDAPPLGRGEGRGVSKLKNRSAGKRSKDSHASNEAGENDVDYSEGSRGEVLSESTACGDEPSCENGRGEDALERTGLRVEMAEKERGSGRKVLKAKD